MRPVKTLDDAPFVDPGDHDRLELGARLDGVRARSCIVRTPGGGMVLGRQEVQALLSDRRLRSPVAPFVELQGVTDGLLHDRMCRTLLALDGADHVRVRSLVRGVFTPNAVERHRPLMRRLLTELVSPLRGRGSCEFVGDVADHFPIQVMCGVLGVPSEDHELFEPWITGIGWALTLSLSAHRDEAESAMRDIDSYVGELLRERRSHPRDDLVSDLVAAEQDGDRLSEDELRSLIIGLLFAGFDTTRNQLGLAVWAFARHPAQWRLLAGEPDRADAAVEEVMRYLGAVAIAPRLVVDAVDVDGYRLPTGTLLMLSTASANHDSSVDASSHDFDITADRQSQLTFGGGPHYCLGANLARAELREALQVLPAAFPDLLLDGEPVWRPRANIWGPERLPIRFTPT